MANGGKRPGAGRKKGSKTKKTLEKLAIQEAFNQRVMTQADALFNAQLTLAVGSVQVYRVEETKDGNKTKREHVLVTNPDEIKKVLDENEGSSGMVEDSYYFVSNLPPDNRAIDSMLNRTLGKPAEKVQHTGEDGGPIQHNVSVEIASKIDKIYG